MWIIDKISRHSIGVFIIRTVIPFAIPFILEIEDEHISKTAKLIIIFIASVFDLILIYFIDKKEKQDNEEALKNKIARNAYSNVYELNERKRNFMVECSYNKEFLIPKKFLPYNVHEYIEEICHSFKNLMCQITSIDKEYVSVSYIYRYIYDGASKEDKTWKWITGREQTMQTPINKFVRQKDTVYYTLIYGKDTSVFYNDKLAMEQENLYYMSSRDRMHNKVGSILGVQLMFSNNAKSFTEGILIISSYGKRFVDDNNEVEINKLRKLVFDDLFPYYQRLLETELGVLYLRHKR